MLMAMPDQLRPLQVEHSQGDLSEALLKVRVQSPTASSSCSVSKGV